jgi:hypothetical protein
MGFPVDGLVSRSFIDLQILGVPAGGEKGAERQAERRRLRGWRHWR